MRPEVQMTVTGFHLECPNKQTDAYEGQPVNLVNFSWVPWRWLFVWAEGTNEEVYASTVHSDQREVQAHSWSTALATGLHIKSSGLYKNRWILFSLIIRFRYPNTVMNQWICQLVYDITQWRHHACKPSYFPLKTPGNPVGSLRSKVSSSAAIRALIIMFIIWMTIN